MSKGEYKEEKGNLKIPKFKTPKWYKLDNASNIFSFITSSEMPSLFRGTATMEDPINVDLLEQAINNILTRFPSFRVTLKSGFFWFYWKPTIAKAKVIADSKFPSQEMLIRQQDIFPFRVRAYKNRIAIEVHHTIADGLGSFVFFSSLLTEYMVLKGYSITEFGPIPRPGQEIRLEEIEDSYKRYYKSNLPTPPRLSRAYQLSYKRLKKGIYLQTTGIIPIDSIKPVAKKYQVTVTEFLVALYIETLQYLQNQEFEKKLKRKLRPIRVSVPINLRSIYPSRTVRNFSLHVMAGIDPRLGNYSYEEILKEVATIRTDVNKKYIGQQISRNVRIENNLLMRLTPLLLKRFLGKFLYKFYGESQFSGTMTNIGIIQFPPQVDEHIKAMRFYPSSNAARRVTCAIGTFRENLFISFVRVCAEKETEKYFFRRMVEMGIKVKVESNV